MDERIGEAGPWTPPCKRCGKPTHHKPSEWADVLKPEAQQKYCWGHFERKEQVYTTHEAIALKKWIRQILDNASSSTKPQAGSVWSATTASSRRKKT